MTPETLKAVLDRIAQWRAEAEIEQQVDERAFQEALKRISERGVPEPLTLHIILGCEWLFRPKKIGSAEVEAVLSEIQKGLAGNMSERAAYLATQALAPAIEKLMREEKRTLASIGTYSPSAPFLIRSDLGKPATERKPPKDEVVPVKPGRIPWPAPWIAGAVVENILRRQGKDSELVLDLVGALLGRKNPVEPQEFARHRRAFPEDALDRYTQCSEQGARWLLSHESLDWQGVLQQSLKEINPAEVFPTDQRLAQAFLDSYGSS